MSYAIFMSYSKADGPWVAWIKNHTDAMGIRTYMYERDQQPGRYISEKVKSEIAASHALVVLLTLHSEKSAYIQQEIGCAEGMGKLVISLVQPGVMQRTPAMLEGKEYIEFDFESPKTALQTLLDYLERLRLQEAMRQAAEQQAEAAKLALFGFGSLLLAAWGLQGDEED